MSRANATNPTYSIVQNPPQRMQNKKRKRNRKKRNRKARTALAYQMFEADLNAATHLTPKYTIRGNTNNGSSKRIITRTPGSRTYLGASVRPCTQMYLASLVDPTGDESMGACIPVGMPVPSQKTRAVQRGTFNLGTTGYGFIIAAPVISNDNSGMLFSTTASVGGSGTVLSSFSNVGTNNQTTQPYSHTQLAGTGVQGRLVSMTVRIKYAGTEANRNGLIFAVEDPDHQDLNTITHATFGVYDNVSVTRPYGSGAWHQINWSGPCTQNEMQWTNFEYANNTNSSYYPLGFAIAGNINDLYEYEVWQNCEYCGRLAIGKTISDSDNEAAGIAQGAAKKAASTQPLQPSMAGTVVRDFLEGVSQVTKQAGYYMGGRAMGAGVNLLTRLAQTAYQSTVSDPAYRIEL